MKADDDTPSVITVRAGGQGANVAAWVCVLGGRAALPGPRTRDPAGKMMIDAQLLARGIALVAGYQDAQCGAVVSLVTAGQRTLAPDPGNAEWINDRLVDTSHGWARKLTIPLGLSAAAPPDPAVVIAAAKAARQISVRVAVDLASGAMIETYGARAFRTLVERLGPTCRVRQRGEVAGRGGSPDRFSVDAVVKRSSAGSTFVVGGVQTSLEVVPGCVVDVTGAGDALAAGYFVGGPPMAMVAVARRIAQTGAQPPY